MTIKEQDPRRDVTIVEMANTLGAGMDSNAHAAMLHRLDQDAIKVLLQHKVLSVNAGEVNCEFDGNEVLLTADTIVIALGMRANSVQINELSQLTIPVFNIGDSVRARGFFHCFHEAWNVVYAISKE